MLGHTMKNASRGFQQVSIKHACSPAAGPLLPCASLSQITTSAISGPAFPRAGSKACYPKGGYGPPDAPLPDHGYHHLRQPPLAGGLGEPYSKAV
jgi:hypothetical protein